MEEDEDEKIIVLQLELMEECEEALKLNWMDEHEKIQDPTQTEWTNAKKTKILFLQCARRLLLKPSRWWLNIFAYLKLLEKKFSQNAKNILF